MSDYKALRHAAQFTCMTVEVSPIELQELLHEVDMLRAGGEKKPAKGTYSVEFEEAWSHYPTRPGNSKAAAFKMWRARLRAGVSPQVMIDGTIKYAAYCKASRTDPQFVKQASTFYGQGEHFAADWTVPRALVDRRTPPPEAPEQTAARRQRWGINLPPEEGDANAIK